MWIFKLLVFLLLKASLVELYFILGIYSDFIISFSRTGIPILNTNYDLEDHRIGTDPCLKHWKREPKSSKYFQAKSWRLLSTAEPTVLGFMSTTARQLGCWRNSSASPGSRWWRTSSQKKRRAFYYRIWTREVSYDLFWTKQGCGSGSAWIQEVKLKYNNW